MTIKCLAVDDEPLAIKIIEKYISELPQLSLVGTCSNALDALSFMKTNDVDLIFLDINMPKLSGISFVRTLKNPPLVVFTTAYPEFAIEGFDLEAVDYLLKPFSIERFIKAVEKVENKIKLLHNANEKEADHIFIKSDKKLFRVLFDEILYVEAYGDYVKIYTKERMLLTKQKFSVLIAELPENRFLQIHRSYVISISALEFLEGNSVQVAGRKLPISGGYKQAVSAILG